VIILDVPESIALARARDRGDNEDRFEKKGSSYHAKVRAAFLQIAKSNQQQYRVIDANQTMDRVSEDIITVINDRLGLSLKANLEIR